MEKKEMNPDLGDAEGKRRKMLALRQEGQISPSLVERMVGKQLPHPHSDFWLFYWDNNKESRTERKNWPSEQRLSETVVRSKTGPRDGWNSVVESCIA